MKQAACKRIEYGGMSMSIPEAWDIETDEIVEFDGQISHSLSITAPGQDVRSIDISLGPLPEGSDAYSEACGTYEEVVGEEGLEALGQGFEDNSGPILSFEFKGKAAYGFSLLTEDNYPCFFFCQEILQADQTEPGRTGSDQNQLKLLTVLMRAADNESLQNLLDFVEDRLAQSSKSASPYFTETTGRSLQRVV